MRNYNFMRPLLILAVAYLVNNIVTIISVILGATKEMADTLGFMSMFIVVIIMYIRFTRNRQKKQD